MTLRGTTRIRTPTGGAHFVSGNGGKAVPLSRAAPGRTKRLPDPGRFSAGGRPSLREESAIFPFLAFHYLCLYHKMS